jgi:hypothetical protein
MAVRLSALRTGRALLPRSIIYLFLILIFGKPQDQARLEGLGEVKKKNHSLQRISKPRPSGL